MDQEGSASGHHASPLERSPATSPAAARPCRRLPTTAPRARPARRACRRPLRTGTAADADPLVVAVGQHQAAAALVGSSEGWLRRHGVAALMVDEAILVSFAQLGINPQRSIASFRLTSTSRTAATS